MLRRYIQYDDTIHRTFKSMQNNYFILFRDANIYGERTDMPGNVHQPQNCGTSAKEGGNVLG